MTKIIDGTSLFAQNVPNTKIWEEKARSLSLVFTSIVESTWFEGGSIFSLDYAEVGYSEAKASTAICYFSVSSLIPNEEPDRYQLQLEFDLNEEFTQASLLEAIKLQVTELLSVLDDDWDEEAISGIES